MCTGFFETYEKAVEDFGSVDVEGFFNQNCR